MSKSLQINAPQIVQTRDTLNAVPSGSTAEPDYSVKFVPQTLSDEQKAQARANIGAAAEGQGGGGTQVQSDWNQTDDTQPDYIKNKPAETLELTMTDENGNVITGTFILSSKTIVPAS